MYFNEITGEADSQYFGPDNFTTTLQVNLVIEGIALPPQMWTYFVKNQLPSFSGNESITCTDGVNAYCTLSRECSAYNSSYAWKFQLSDGSDYMLLPLVSLLS